MTDYRAIERRFREGLGLTRRPVAVGFRDVAPAGVTRFTGSEPSGCSFWRLAMEGRAFEAETIANANAALADYHRGRRAELARD